MQPRSAGVTVQQTLFNGQPDRQQDPRRREPGFRARGKRCAACLSRPCCCLAATILHGLPARLRHRSRFRRATYKGARTDAEADQATASMSAKSPAPTWRSPKRSWPPARPRQLTAESNLVTTTLANFRRSHRQRAREALAPGSPVDRFPAGRRSLRPRSNSCLTENPNVTAAMYRHRRQLPASQGQRGRAVADGRRCRLRCNTSYEQSLECLFRLEFGACRRVGQLTVPVYQGGAEYALIRQSKENAGAAAPQSRTGHATRPAPAWRSAWGQFAGGQGAGAVRASHRSPRPRSRSTACARKPRPASAPRSTC